MSIQRHYFPGNNTPEGFFSYYKYQLGHGKKNRIFCIKGGPGSGKSTFINCISQAFDDEDIDFLHCSADENSLDGIVLKNKRVVIVDGTSPHIIDPITPGALDKIINLGEFWNEDGLKCNKNEIIHYNEKCKEWYNISYNYLNSAKSLLRSLESIYNLAIEYHLIYGLVADIVYDIFKDYNINMRPGIEKKHFASAITANGIVHYLNTLVTNLEKVYLINVPLGYHNKSFMSIIKEGAIYRGLNVETFYCPMFADEKIEHLIIPELNCGFITVNDYHDIEPWEIYNYEEKKQEIVLLDISDYMNNLLISEKDNLIESLTIEIDILLSKGFKALFEAKKYHNYVEDLYIPNMNFMNIQELCKRTVEEIKRS